MASRRGFLGALAAVPFLGALAKGEPVKAGPTSTEVVCFWKDGRHDRLTVSRPLPDIVSRPRSIHAPQNVADFSDDGLFPTSHTVERVEFRHVHVTAQWHPAAAREGDRYLPIYEEVPEHDPFDHGSFHGVSRRTYPRLKKPGEV